MDRRQFLGWVGVGALASSLPVVLAACKSETEESTAGTESPAPSENSSPTTPNSDAGGGGFATVGTVAQLDESDLILDKGLAKPVLVVRNPDSKELSAVNPTCTHRGCTVEFDKAAKQFACPCHGAKYSLDGSVVEGPAERALASFEAKEEEGSILVKVS